MKKRLFQLIQKVGIFTMSIVLIKFMPIVKENIPYVAIYIIGIVLTLIGAWTEGYFDD